jgi:hypothetical protein
MFEIIVKKYKATRWLCCGAKQYNEGSGNWGIHQFIFLHFLR